MLLNKHKCELVRGFCHCVKCTRMPGVAKKLVRIVQDRYEDSRYNWWVSGESGTPMVMDTLT